PPAECGRVDVADQQASILRRGDDPSAVDQTFVAGDPDALTRSELRAQLTFEALRLFRAVVGIGEGQVRLRHARSTRPDLTAIAGVGPLALLAPVQHDGPSVHLAAAGAIVKNDHAWSPRRGGSPTPRLDHRVAGERSRTDDAPVHRSPAGPIRQQRRERTPAP